MKKSLILFLFLLCGISLFAQTSGGVRIFVPPVSGIDRHEDAAFFYKQLSDEVVRQYFTLVRRRQGSQFTIQGSIASSADMALMGVLEEKEISRALEIIQNYNSLKDLEEYTFSLDLIDSVTDETIASQHFVYNSIDDASIGDFVSIVVYNLLSIIPGIYDADPWRDKLLSFGLSGLWTPRIYTYQQRSTNWANYGLAFSFEYFYWDFLSVNLETQFVWDSVIAHSDLMLEIPLYVKYVFKPHGAFTLEPYTGISFNFSLMGFTKPSPCSWLVGLQFGLNAGPGMVVIDPRFSMDFTKSVLPQNSTTYHRSMMQIAIGYKIGIFPK